MKLRLSDVASVAEVIGAIAIVISLIYVGIQVKQNNSLLESETRATRVQIRADEWNRLAESPEIVALLVKDRNGAALSEEEELRLNAFWMTTIYVNQWLYEGLSESTEWIAPLRRNFVTYSSLRNTWQGAGSGARSAGKDNFSADFVRLVDEQVVAQP